MSTDYLRLFSTFTLITDFDLWYSYLKPEWHDFSKPYMIEDIHRNYVHAMLQSLADEDRLRVRRVIGIHETNGHYTDILDADGNIVETITGLTYEKYDCHKAILFTLPEEDDCITINLIVDAISLPSLPEFHDIHGEYTSLWSNFVSDLYQTFKITIKREYVTDTRH